MPNLLFTAGGKLAVRANGKAFDTANGTGCAPCCGGAPCDFCVAPPECTNTEDDAFWDNTVHSCDTATALTVTVSWTGGVYTAVTIGGCSFMNGETKSLGPMTTLYATREELAYACIYDVAARGCTVDAFVGTGVLAARGQIRYPCEGFNDCTVVWAGYFVEGNAEDGLNPPLNFTGARHDAWTTPCAPDHPAGIAVSSGGSGMYFDSAASTALTGVPPDSDYDYYFRNTYTAVFTLPDGDVTVVVVP